MDRIISSEERIRRAEEIYNRRRQINGVRVSSTSVNIVAKNKYRLYKKLILQILLCFMTYFIFYIIRNSNYIFSENFIEKTKEFLNYDINFGSIYLKATEYYNNNLKSFFAIKEISENENKNVNEEKQEGNISDESNENDENDKINQEKGIGGGEDNSIETLGENNMEGGEIQENIQEISETQMEQDAKYIKENYNMILPLKGYIVTSRYGQREGNEIVSSNHKGIDIGANSGTVFVAAMEGTVITSSSEGTYGNHIFIQNGDVITVYAHCKKLYVRNGDTIKQGQKLGEVGATGNATGPHLHFELRVQNRTVDPEYVLSFS